MGRDQVRFCRERKDKRLHAQQLQLTHFIDDRADVLDHLRGLVPHLFLFGVQKHPAPAWTTPALDWREVARLLLAEPS